MVWLSLLVLMLLIAAAPGVSIYVEHRNQAAQELANPAVEPVSES